MCSDNRSQSPYDCVITDWQGITQQTLCVYSILRPHRAALAGKAEGPPPEQVCQVEQEWGDLALGMLPYQGSRLQLQGEVYNI